MDKTNQIIKLHHISNELMVMMQRLNEIGNSIRDNDLLENQNKLEIVANINAGCKFISTAYIKTKFEYNLKK